MPALLSGDDEDQVSAVVGDQETSADIVESDEALDGTALRPVVVAASNAKSDEAMDGTALRPVVSEVRKSAFPLLWDIL